VAVRRVEGVDSGFLAGETPEWHFHVSALQIVDPRGTPDFGFDAFREACRQRISLVPQFRWRLVVPPFGLGWSYFVDDPEFDVDDHLHHVALPPPGAASSSTASSVISSAARSTASGRSGRCGSSMGWRAAGRRS
jgi:hypothetical protein